MPDSGNWQKPLGGGGLDSLCRSAAGVRPHGHRPNDNETHLRRPRPCGHRFLGILLFGADVWQDGVRPPDSKFNHYLPSVDVAFGLLAWMPFSLAAVVWLAIMIAAWLCLLAAVHRDLLCDYDPTQARRSILVAGLLVMAIFVNHLCVGAFHVLMVWWMVAGLGRVSRRRPWSGGLMLGMAVWIKLLPLVGVGYLLLKRKWLPAVLALATAVVIDLALSLAAFGPRHTWQLHRQWFHSEAHGEQSRMLTDARPLDEDRLNNQSAMIVMRRLLTDMGHGTAADRAEAARRGDRVRPGEVGSVDYGGFRPNVTIAHLTPNQLQFTYAAAMLLLALGILIYCRRPGCKLSPKQWSAEIALVVLATLWFSPLVWSYHITAAAGVGGDLRPRAHPRMAQATAALWVLSLFLMASSLARALGVTLWVDVLLGVILVAVQNLLRRMRPPATCSCAGPTTIIGVSGGRGAGNSVRNRPRRC